jgi:hypothetical protein
LQYGLSRKFSGTAARILAARRLNVTSTPLNTRVSLPILSVGVIR